MSNSKKWIVITSGDEPIQNVAEQLKQKGFQVEMTLDAIGQIIGEANEDVKNDAAKIKGVVDIIASHDDINIGPPDSNTTW